jgi:hypothetical protein
MILGRLLPTPSSGLPVSYCEGRAGKDGALVFGDDWAPRIAGWLESIDDNVGSAIKLLGGPNWKMVPPREEEGDSFPAAPNPRFLPRTKVQVTQP